jgi:hypothetical protein
LKLLVGLWHLLKQLMAFGNPTAGGFTTAAEALWAVARLNERLMAKFGMFFSVSAHWWHELLVPADVPEVGYSAEWNNARAINLDQWIDGVRCGQYAPIGRIIPAGFGLPGSDNGNHINPDPKRRQLAHDMIVLSFAVSERVKAEGVGEGDVIYWTGPDGIRWQLLVNGSDICLSHELNPQLEEWGLIMNGVGGGCRDARAKGYAKTRILVEGKPAGDPDYIDAMTDTVLEIKGIRAINEVAGAKVAVWQGEFCHTRGSGETFASGMALAMAGGDRELADAMLDAICSPVRADEPGMHISLRGYQKFEGFLAKVVESVFDGTIHFNSGGLGAQIFTELLSRPGGTPISEFQQYVDNDFQPGEGVAEWVSDQRNAIKLCVAWSAATGKPAEIEFDARFCRYADTIGALEKSAEWTINAFNEAAASLEAQISAAVAPTV